MRGRAGAEARARASTRSAVEDPIAGDPVPGLFEPQYVSLLECERVRCECWKGERNAKTARLGVMGVVVVESEGDVEDDRETRAGAGAGARVGLGDARGVGGGGDLGNHGVGAGVGDHSADAGAHDCGDAAREGDKTDGGNAVADGENAHRHSKGLAVVDIADRKSCRIRG